MKNENNKSDQEKEIERDIRSRQKFTISSALSRSSGGSLKGRSTAPQLVQATAHIVSFITTELHDLTGALLAALIERVKNDEIRISTHIDKPLDALKELLDEIIEHESILHEFVRQVDTHSGMILSERPVFQEPGDAPDPDDEYTHQSVKRALEELLKKT